MTMETLAVIMRMVERSLIVLGGILSIYLGYRLFALGIDKTQGEASAFGMTLKNFGPGLFFAALGAYVLVVSMKASIQTGYTGKQPGTEKVAVVQEAVKPFFFGIEDPSRQLKQWSAKSFFIDTRELISKRKEKVPEQELEMLEKNILAKIDSITMTKEEYQSYKDLTNKVSLSPEEVEALSKLEKKLFPLK